MKISYHWLRDLFPVERSAEETAEILTNTGLEVEGLEAFVSVEGGLEGLVIGEVLEKTKHPNADRLNLTKVNIGKGEPLHIVCGAPNVDAGQKVVVATIGAMLYPSEGEPFKIKKGKIRGEVSEGMICAEDEIGLGDGHDGIMVLDSTAVPGTPAADYFNIYRDQVFEIGLTPNRTDAMSHHGVARDLRAALMHAEDLRSEQVPELKLNETHLNLSASNKRDIQIDVQAKDACPRYAGLCIEGIKVAPSPEWLQNRLKAIGLSPINNIVDITNYVMHEVGQPLHAFDLEKIEGGKVVVRFAKAKEKFVTLDDEERELSEEDLMICDAQKPMCIAGVFGGAHSGISEQSTSVFLESAVFDAVSVRKTSKRHLLHTDAAYRFERGVDPEMTIYALERATQLILEIAGGEIVSQVMDEYPVPHSRAEISIDLNRIARLIGKAIPKPQVLSLLHDLDFDVLEDKEERLRLSAPLYRRDVTREADVAEEILRIYGYNNIEMPERLHSTLSFAPKPDPEALVNKVADMLVARGFHEIMSNSLTKLSYTELIDRKDHQASTAVRMKNPLSQDLGQLRQSLLFQGLECILRNTNHKQSDLALFEFGRVYHRIDGNMVETPKLAIWMTGKRRPESWNNSEDSSDFYALRDAAQSVLMRLGIHGESLVRDAEHPYFSQHLAMQKVHRSAPNQPKELGVMGILDPKLCSAFDIDSEVYYAELDWGLLIELAGMVEVVYEEPPKFPSVRRDLSLLLDRNIDFASIREIAEQTERKLLRDVQLFDVYEGKNIAKDKKSYAVAFILEDRKATLTDKKIDKSMQRIQQALTKELGAELRS